MLELFRGGALAAATLTTGLMAGLYYAYAISVMLGLSMTDDRTFLSAMQQINVAILNPWFFVSFFGALVSLPWPECFICPGIGEPCCLGSWLRSSYTWRRSSSQSALTCRSTMNSPRQETPTASPILQRCASASKRAGSGGTSPARWHPRLRLAASSGLLCYTGARFDPGRDLTPGPIGQEPSCPTDASAGRYDEVVREVRYYPKAAHLSQLRSQALDRGYADLRESLPSSHFGELGSDGCIELHSVASWCFAEPLADTETFRGR